MSSVRVVPAEDFQTIPFAISWRGLLWISAIGELALLLATILALQDILAAALALLLLVGLVALKFAGRLLRTLDLVVFFLLNVRFRRRAGQMWTLAALALALLFADIGFYTLTGAAANLMSGAHGISILLPASLAAFAVTGFVSAVICLIKRRRRSVPSRGALNFAIAVLVVWLVVLGIGVLGRPASARAARPSDIKLETENMAYSSKALTARAGEIVLELDNHDLFWHTFTSDELGVDLRVPMTASQQIRFTAEPGVYRFHCTIPGHEMLGMVGALTVQ
jgi:plastocyanin